MRAWFFIMLLFAASAAAQSDDDRLIHRGVELRKQGQNAEALALFREAYEHDPSARAEAQVALAQQALGHWVEAEAGLVAVLANENDAWIERNRDTLEAALATIRDHLGTLEIETSVNGATILVNGAVVGVSPLPGALRLVAGSAHIEVQAEGYGAVKREIEVPPHASVTAAIVLVPPASPAPRAAPAPSTPAPVPANVPAATSSQATHDGNTGSARTLGYVLLAASAPLLATGIVANVVRENNAQSYNAPGCFVGNETRDQRCGDKRSAANTAGVISVIGYATAGAALITGATLLLTRHSARAREGQPQIDASLGPHTASLECQIAF